MPIPRQCYAVCRQERIAAPAETAFKDFLIKRGAVHLPLLGKLYPAEGILAVG
ncbi:hypothetical protein [Aurantimonas marianensis]|uniref:Uncharacterized protein n=1 Tax=Aurantimonas marianensis TaxID=2920428 RepID=A0A9X2KDH8_9HYPH|nr:hypothetical protein [Aurantimonas marianensis]MCP3054383.1 hypothetical protein [Aurantimonas marianensis]